MSESTIGIKIANGEFFPVLNEQDRIKKRLILTTVNNNQESVQIDLYKGREDGSSIENASYIGSLIIEDIAPGLSGEPDIELLLNVDGEGNLNATASDRQSGDMQSLSVNLDSVAEPESYDLPDFELNDEFNSELDTDSMDDDFTASSQSFGDDWESESTSSGVTPEEESRLTGTGKKRVNPLLLAAFIIAGLAVIGLLIILLLRSFPGEATPPLQARGEQVQTVTEQESPAAEVPAAVPSVQSEPVPSEPAVSTEPAASPEAAVVEEVHIGGFFYDIKYGDTLWDLSISFYRTPWLYGHIADENNIENPDLIYWGTQIYIPKQ